MDNNVRQISCSHFGHVCGDAVQGVVSVNDPRGRVCCPRAVSDGFGCSVALSETRRA